MTDTYDHKGVTITPQPGGFYELAHPSLPAAIRVRGKENAEAAAEDIAAANPAPDDAHIPPQGAILDDVPPVLPEGGTVTDAPADEVVPAAPDMTAMLLEQNAAMMAQMQAMMNRMAEMEAAGVQTVGVTGEISGDTSSGAPQSYRGAMEKGARKALEALGHKIVKIILEESEHIPPTGLFIGHNGRSYMIQPGVPVDVPDFLVSVLDDAVTSSPVVNPDTKKVVGYRDRLKYSYRRVD